MNNKAKFTLSFLVSIACLATSFAAQAADDLFSLTPLDTTAGAMTWRVSSFNSTTGVSTALLDSNLTHTQLVGGTASSGSFANPYEGKFYIAGNDALGNSGYTVYDVKTNTLARVTLPVVSPLFGAFDWGGTNIIRKENDGSIRIGENSLVTIEENGAQSLRATDATDNAINIDINGGSDLLINGVSVSQSISQNALSVTQNTQSVSQNTLSVTQNTQSIFQNARSISSNGRSLIALRSDMRRYSKRAIALSSAFSALPTQSKDSGYTCGMGVGARGRFSAMSIGCATDFSNFSFSDKMPTVFKNASLNAGSSFLMHDDLDFTFKVGLSFKLGAPKSTVTVSSRDYASKHALRVVRQEKRAIEKKNIRLKELVEENKQLQAQLDDIKARLADETKTRLVAIDEIKVQLAALTEARVAMN